MRRDQAEGKTCRVRADKLTVGGRYEKRQRWAEHELERSAAVGAYQANKGEASELWGNKEHAETDAMVVQDQDAAASRLFELESGEKIRVATSKGGYEVMVAICGVFEHDFMGRCRWAVDVCGNRRVVFEPMTAPITQEEASMGASETQFYLRTKRWTTNKRAMKLSLEKQLEQFRQKKEQPMLGEVLDLLRAATGTETMQRATCHLTDEEIGPMGRYHRQIMQADDSVKQLATCVVQIEDINNNNSAPPTEVEKLRVLVNKTGEYGEHSNTAFQFAFDTLLMGTSEEMVAAMNGAEVVEDNRHKYARGAWKLAMVLGHIPDMSDTAAVQERMCAGHVAEIEMRSVMVKIAEDGAERREMMRIRNAQIARVTVEGATVVRLHADGVAGDGKGICIAERPPTPHNRMSQADVRPHPASNK